MSDKTTNLPFSSKTPATLREEFSSLFGAGTYARIVWQVEERDGRKANFDLGGRSRLLVLDTREGSIRELVSSRTGTHWSAPSFSWNGEWVTFTDNEQKQVLAIRWDGTGERILRTGCEGDGHCWQSPDGKQWAIITDRDENPDAPVKVCLVNIEDPDEKRELFTTRWGRPEWAGSTCWASLSADGTHIAAGFPNYDDLGLMELATGTIKKFSVNGCWPSIARDKSYDVLYTNAGSDAHRTVRIVDRNQNELLLKDLRPAVLANDEFYESLRWTPDRDFITISVYRAGFLSAGLPSPRIVRLSDLRYVAINETPSTPEGNADVFFYSE